MPSTARGTALAALVEVEAGARANVVVPELLGRSHLDQRDRHLVTELVYGTCRMKRACDWILDRHVRGRTDVLVRAALRLGVYQLGWMRVPPHAAVSATVSEVAGPGRKLVNAVLRRCADDLARGLVSWPRPAVELSYPDWIVERLCADLGRKRALAALRTMNEPASVTTRADGYVQDRASQIIAAHLAALAGDGPVIDLCAAPGGKATALAGAAFTVAADLSGSRTQIIAANAARLGVRSVSAMVADGMRAPFRPGSAALVLVDAPCSGLGVLRRRPDARWRVGPRDVDRLADLQRRLLASAASLVRPGGVLAYSVCTLTSTETAAIDRWMAAELKGFQPLPPPGAPWERAGRGAMLLPQTDGTDGMFMAVTRRMPG